MAHSTTNPSYYQRGTIQVWDFIRDQGLNFHLGNAIKYICRYGHKGDYNSQISDLKKAITYLNDELHNLEFSRNREDLPRHHPSNSPIFTSEGVSSSVQRIEFERPSGTYQAAEFDYGGVQGISGGGSDFISL